MESIVAELRFLNLKRLLAYEYEEGWVLVQGQCVEAGFLSFTMSFLEGGLRQSLVEKFYLMNHLNGPDLTLFETFMRLNIFHVYINYKTVRFFPN